MGVKMTPSTDPRYPDEETKKIVEELEGSGVKLPFKKDDPTPPPPRSSQEDDEEEGEDNPPENQPGEPEKKPEEKKPEENPEKKPEDKKPEDNQRDPKETLIVALKRDKKKLEESIDNLTNEITTLRSKIEGGGKPTDQQKEKVEQSADKLEQLVTTIVSANEGVDPALVKSILEAAKSLSASGNPISPELQAKIDNISATEDKLKQQEEEQQAIQQEQQRFDEEFSSEISGNADIKKAIADSGITLDEFKMKIFDFIYSEEGRRYTGVPLSEIFSLKRDRFLPAHRKSAERSQGGSTSGDTKGDRPPTAAEIEAMSPEEFEKYSNDMAAKHRPKVMNRGKPVN